jgi:molecular chaperone Hsp33
VNEAQGFLLEDSGIRGGLVRLTETWQRVIAQHEYSAPIKSLLGEGVAATVLLATGLKAKPSVSLQLQGEGALKLLLIQCSQELRVRGMAKGNSTAPVGAELLGEGRLVVNVDTGKPQGFFQGIVPLESTRLDACLEAYFRQSEQLPTRLILKATEQRSAGLLLQVLPGQSFDADVFEAAAAAARAITIADLAEVDARELLPKVFAHHVIRLFQPRPVLHDCRCTPERLAGVIRMLGEDEVKTLLADEGRVELTCEFCNRAFRYDEVAVDAIMRGESRSTRLH